MGVVEGSIFMVRDLHFRIRRPIFATGADFLFNLTSLKFKGVGHGCGHFPMIFEFAVPNLILVPIFVAIRASFVFSSFSSSSLSISVLTYVESLMCEVRYLTGHVLQMVWSRWMHA